MSCQYFFGVISFYHHDARFCSGDFQPQRFTVVRSWWNSEESVSPNIDRVGKLQQFNETVNTRRRGKWKLSKSKGRVRFNSAGLDSRGGFSKRFATRLLLNLRSCFRLIAKLCPPIVQRNHDRLLDVKGCALTHFRSSVSPWVIIWTRAPYKSSHAKTEQLLFFLSRNVTGKGKGERAQECWKWLIWKYYELFLAEHLASLRQLRGK